MPKFLTASDFRARRRVLLKSDFALAEGRSPRPSDKIDKATWNHIVILPDDVAIRTTNHHGSAIKQISDLAHEWVLRSDETDHIMLPVMMDAHDDFDAALYAAITGYYRLANSAMRSALELVTIGTWAKLCGKQREFKKWEKGEIELSLGIACDGLIGATPALRTKLETLVNDSLFDQKTNTTDGGWVRRAFRDISDFSHSRPGYTDYSMRKSNGPIYVPSAFNYSMRIQTETIGLLFVLLLIATPSARFNRVVVDLFADTSKVTSRVTRAAFQILHP
jgi:hypothetical protein